MSDRPELECVLGFNLAIAGGLQHAYATGRRACPCDVGPTGFEWYPGEGVTPEDLEGNRWLDEPHEYQPATFGLCGVACGACGEGPDGALHDAEWIAQTRTDHDAPEDPIDP